MKDKDSIILKYEQERLKDIDKGVDDLVRGNDDLEDRLNVLKQKVADLYQKTGKEPIKASNVSPSIKEDSTLVAPENTDDYEELFMQALDDLTNRGLDPDDFDYHGLVSENELREIMKELNEGLPREVKWKKSDFIVTFIAALVGCIADIILGNRNNKFTGQNSEFSKKLDNLHEKTFKHAKNAPIDYQGKPLDSLRNGFGGGYHRELSKGHDLMRFVEGIKSFKNGQFEGVIFENGVAHPVLMTANQYGNSYEQLSILVAIERYCHHMFADLFSTYSLPFPGYSFFSESKYRDLRVLASDMYQNGFNCKNVITQSLSTIIIEIIVRTYFGIQSVLEYKDKIEIAEDYSNIDAIKAFMKPQSKEKLNEMLLVAHAIVMAENIGKIIITKNIASINITEIVSVVRYGYAVVKKIYERNNEYAKLIYHAEIVNKGWESIDQNYYAQEQIAIEEIEDLII